VRESGADPAVIIIEENRTTNIRLDWQLNQILSLETRADAV